MLAIEKNVPIPPPATGRGGRQRGGTNRIRWAQMEVGDSVMIPTDRPERAACDASTRANQLGIKVTTRRVDGGIRVWRTA